MLNTALRRFGPAALMVAALVLPQAAGAHGFQIGDIAIGHPWARATAPGAPVAGGFMKLSNKSAVADTLVSATFVAAGRVELHEMAVVDGVMKMRALPTGLTVKPGETVELKPGGFHVMFMDLKQPLKQGDKIKGTLTFEKAGSIEVEYAIESLTAGANAAHPGH